MISKVAPPITDTAVATPAAGDSADSGVFDVLLTLHSLASANAEAATAATAQQASPPEGAEVLAGMLEDIGEESTDDPAKDAAEPTDDALWFLSALLTVLKVPAPAVPTGSAVAANTHSDTPLAAAPLPAATQEAITRELAQAFAFGPASAEAGDAQTQTQTPTPNSQSVVAPVIDTTTWSSMSGPAELFAQATKQGTVERADSAPLTTHVRDPRWADDLGHRLASMVRTGESSASLQLTPADLGPLEVNVSVKENQATVHFGASNADTRALLEASMPRLREMLASQGFQLMDSSVSHGFARQARHEAAGTPRINAEGDASALPVQAIHITGLLDLYA